MVSRAGGRSVGLYDCLFECLCASLSVGRPVGKSVGRSACRCVGVSVGVSVGLAGSLAGLEDECQLIQCFQFLRHFVNKSVSKPARPYSGRKGNCPRGSGLDLATACDQWGGAATFGAAKKNGERRTGNGDGKWGNVLSSKISECRNFGSLGMPLRLINLH